MAIVSIPRDVELTGAVNCELCTKRIPLAKATVGPQAANSRQTFACNDHFYSSAQYILGWVGFMLAKRQVAVNR